MSRNVSKDLMTLWDRVRGTVVEEAWSGLLSPICYTLISASCEVEIKIENKVTSAEFTNYQLNQ